MSTQANSPLTDTASVQAVSRYTRTAMVLHWIIAILIICNVVLGLSADSLPDDWVRPVIDTHKSIGITVLGLVLLRILWRVSHKPPPLPAEFPSWERMRRARCALPALFVDDRPAAVRLVARFGMEGRGHASNASVQPVPWPRIGYVMNLDPTLKETLHDRFGALHTWLGYALYALLAMHVGGALKHEWIDRKSVLKRMIP